MTYSLSRAFIKSHRSGIFAKRRARRQHDEDRVGLVPFASRHWHDIFLKIAAQIDYIETCWIMSIRDFLRMYNADG
jgi:hypothetical protein